MKRSLATLFGSLLCASAAAQDLSNPSFESSWSSGAPPHWTVRTTGLTTVYSTGAGARIHCGSASCKVTCTNGNETQHFAKEWQVTGSSAIKVGDVVMAKLRIWFPTGQNLGSGGVYARATGVDTVTRADVGTQTQIQLTPLDGWQEQTVRYTVTTVPANGLTIRVGLRFVRGLTNGVHVWLDDVFFQGTSTSFGALQAPGCAEPDFEVTSLGLKVKLAAYSGVITGIEDTILGVSLSPLVPATVPLFAIQTNPGVTPSATISTSSYDYCVIRPPLSGEPWLVESASKATGAPGEASKIKVSARISPSATTSDISFAVDVADTNTTGRVFNQITCPVLKLSPMLGSSDADDTVFVPGGDGWTVRGSGIFQLTGSNGVWSHTREYPGSASMQFAAYFDDTRGLCVEAHDASGECKQLGFVAQHGSSDDNVQLILTRRYPYQLGQTISSYPVVIARCAGRWENAAKHYRAWARAQSFATAPKYLGSPTWIRERHPVYNSSLEVMGNTLYLVPPDRWREVMDAWTTALDVPATPGADVHMTVLSRNFEHHGVFTSPYYTPLHPDDTTVSNMWAELDAQGHHTMAMVSGLKWMKRRDQWPPPPPVYPVVGGQVYWVQAFEGCGSENDGCVTDQRGNVIDAWYGQYQNADGSYNPAAPDVCVVDVNGVVMHVDTPENWDGDHGWMCPGHSYANPATCLPRKLLAEFASHVAARHLQLFELDQMNGGGVQPCYSTAHGHPRGYGKWIYERIASIMQAVRDVRLGGAYPSFAMSMEDPGELYLPWLDGSFGRTHHLDSWPADAIAGALVVPAFLYVYSDLSVGLAADLLIGARKQNGQDDAWNEAASIVELSRSWVSSGWLYFEAAPWMVYADWKTGPDWEPVPAHINSKHLAFIQHCVASNSAPGKTWFDVGRMVSADGFTCGTFSYSKIENGVPVPHTVAAVSHSAWRLDATGCIALMLANADSVAATTTVTLPTGFDGVSHVGTPFQVWRNGVAAETGTLLPSTPLTLAPLEVVVVVVGNRC